MCIDTYNNIYIFGDNNHGQLGILKNSNKIEPIKHPSLSNIIDISKGGNQTFVKTSNNEIYAFGDNKYFQLGVEGVKSDSNSTSKPRFIFDFDYFRPGINKENKIQNTPVQTLQGNEDKWSLATQRKSRAKSARFTSQLSKGDITPPIKKQKIEL